MENASKALIIAGAILLAILIISLGLIVYNQAKETVGSVNLTQQEIQAFNNKFTSFEGTSVSGDKVNRLIQTVISSNQAEIDGATGKYVGICFESASGYDEGGASYDNAEVAVVVNKTSGKLNYSVIGYIDSNDYVSDWMENGAGCKEDTTGGFFSEWEETSKASLKVTPGKTYKVTLGYKNGVVDRIGVAEN